MDATPTVRRRRQSLHIETEESELLHDTRTGRQDYITDVHLGHRFDGQRARHHADQEQSIQSIHAASAHDALLATGVMDVGGRGRRTGQ